MTQPREIEHGSYRAIISKEEDTPWGLCTTWMIMREGVEVGKMFHGSPGYGERPHCSMSALVWAGDLPEKSWSPKSPHYGIHFDTGPHDTLEAALSNFAARADRLIAWRASSRVASS